MSLVFVAKNAALVVMEVINVAIIALEEGKKGDTEDFSVTNKRNGFDTKHRQGSKQIRSPASWGEYSPW